MGSNGTGKSVKVSLSEVSQPKGGTWVLGQGEAGCLKADLPDLYYFKSLKCNEKFTFHLNYVVTKKRGF
jgi:hypothetical protein